MNGIEILSTAEMVAATACNATAVGIGVIATIVVMAIIGVFVAWYQDDAMYVVLFLLFSLVFSALTAVMIAETTSYPTEYETHYKVTIDDNVSMNEFNEKYEIINQEGKIYTIRERKQQNSK